MTLTNFHSKFFAHELTKRCASDSIEKLAGPLVDAQVDLNPHQVEAALFAFRSPLSRGGILADEVGLGKTIEAGLVLSQKWAERKRRLLVITPANLRKQWHQELQEKFFLPGRCHRYGQKHDVVAVNFINRNNEADQRVFELLDKKFKLFEGVFGASDEVLGAIESGVDFEKRIARIYQVCRTPDEIRASFALLQQELTAQINEAMTTTRRQLLENFDEEVHEKLKVSKTRSEGFQNRYEKMLMRLSRHELNGHAEFAESEESFDLTVNPFPGLDPTGHYELPRRTGNAHLYRLGHPLAAQLVRQAIERPHGRLFEEEATKLDGWAEDLKVGLEREIKDLDRQLREARRAASACLTLEEKLAGQRQVKKLESERNDKRRTLFVAQDEIEQRRDKLIESVQAKLEQKVTLERILSIRWRIT